ncbi:MAG: hypothetical protein ABH879_09330 [archaeon]
MNKRGMLESTLGKMIFILALLLVLLGLVALFSGKMNSVWEGIANMLQFG